jgi:hypothetical protein
MNHNPAMPLPQAPTGWLCHRGIPAWLLSLALHLTVFLVLGLVVQVAPRGRPDAGETGRGGTIALVRDVAGKTEYFSDEPGSPAEGMATTAQQASAAPLAAALPQAAELPDTGGPQLPSAQGVAVQDAGDAAPSAGDFLGLGAGAARGGGLGNNAQTEVFGVPGEGTRFVYVFDRSASMAGFGGRPLAAAKRELIESIQRLDRVHEFQIIFYNQQPRLMRLADGRSSMIFANDDAKRAAARFVQGVGADGATDHLPALTAALGLRPDVIFFLTDADEPVLGTEELAKIRRLNHGASINAIEFGSGPPSGRNSFLRRLAQENGGNYGYVDVTRLPRP